MALGKKRKKRQKDLWIAADEVAQAPGHPFYEKLNGVLEEAGFDEQLEELARPYYAAKMGRPSLPPGVYIRMLLVGYFEGIDSERGIAWRSADSLAIREFLGYKLTERTPDHSTLSAARRRLPKEFHQEAFSLVLRLLADKGLVKGDTLAVDATTMEANAAMRSLVRTATGETYKQFLAELAKESGIETPSAEDLKRFDRKRKGKKTSNDDWHNPHDPDAKITKTKGGPTKLAYKAEHAADLDTEVILGAEIHPADAGDTTSGPKTLERADEELTLWGRGWRGSSGARRRL